MGGGTYKHIATTARTSPSPLCQPPPVCTPPQSRHPFSLRLLLNPPSLPLGRLPTMPPLPDPSPPQTLNAPRLAICYARAASEGMGVRAARGPCGWGELDLKCARGLPSPEG